MTPQPVSDGGSASDAATPILGPDPAAAVCASPSPDAGPPIESLGCHVCVTGASGAVLCVGADNCVFKSGEGATFRYELRIAQPVMMQVPQSLPCGSCTRYSTDPSTFVDIEIISLSSAVRYCPSCDRGCCAGNDEQTITLQGTTCDGTFVWPGRQWDGPSDTGNGLGAPFPPGSYVLRATFGADSPADAVANLGIEVLQ